MNSIGSLRKTEGVRKHNPVCSCTCLMGFFFLLLERVHWIKNAAQVFVCELTAFAYVVFNILNKQFAVLVMADSMF